MVPRINPITKTMIALECARFGCPEHRASEPFRPVRQAVPRRLHRPQGARSKAVFCGSICASWVAARRYRPTCRPGRGLHHPSASRTPKSRIPGKRAQAPSGESLLGDNDPPRQRRPMRESKREAPPVGLLRDCCPRSLKYHESRRSHDHRLKDNRRHPNALDIERVGCTRREI